MLFALLSLFFYHRIVGDKMKTILCYGDSNTWGYDPKNLCRHDHNTRWPMALKNILNKDAPPDEPEWWVVEEGQGGRTSCREDPIEEN